MCATRILGVAGLGGVLLCACAVDAAYTGIYWEIYDNPAYDAPPDSITFRFYATFDNEMDQVLGLGGTADEPWYLQTNVVFYQDD